MYYKTGNINNHQPLFNMIEAEPSLPWGRARMWWLGQMGICLKLGDTVLCIDYYASEDPDRMVDPPAAPQEVTGVDAFLGTHDHIDHIDWPSWKVWASVCPKASFILPAAVIRSRDSKAPAFSAELSGESSLESSGELSPESFDGRLIGLNDGDSCQIRDIKITAIPAAHEFLNQDPQTGLYPCLQFIIEGYGMRIYHAGDTLRYEGMLPRLQQFGHIDAAILPINGRDGVRYRSDCIGNMTFQEAADLAGELGVGTVIPGHWNLFAHNSEDPARFADYLDAKYGTAVTCIIPEVGETIDLSAR